MSHLTNTEWEEEKSVKSKKGEEKFPRCFHSVAWSPFLAHLLNDFIIFFW